MNTSSWLTDKLRSEEPAAVSFVEKFENDERMPNDAYRQKKFNPLKVNLLQMAGENYKMLPQKNISSKCWKI